MKYWLLHLCVKYLSITTLFNYPNKCILWMIIWFCAKVKMWQCAHWRHASTQGFSNVLLVRQSIKSCLNVLCVLKWYYRFVLKWRHGWTSQVNLNDYINLYQIRTIVIFFQHWYICTTSKPLCEHGLSYYCNAFCNCFELYHICDLNSTKSVMFIFVYHHTHLRIEPVSDHDLGLIY